MSCETIFYLLAWFVILIPFSVDQKLSWELGPYSIRMQYIGAAFWVLLYGIECFKKKSLKGFSPIWQGRENWFFAAMAFPALAAIAYVPAPFNRTVYFTLWTVGTMTCVPWLARKIMEKLGIIARGSFYLYYGIQALIICLDAAICIPSGGKHSIGRVMVYMGQHAMDLCRPSAFYQEPGYFSATAGLVLLLMQFDLNREQISPAIRWSLQGLRGLILLGMVLCLSRLGWLLVLVLLGLALFSFLKAEPSKKITWSMFIPRTNRVRFFLGFIAVGLFLIGSMAVPKYGPVIYSYLGRPVPSTDGSILARTRSIGYAWREVAFSPWVGVGPGNSGNFFVQKYSEEFKSDIINYKNVPLATTAYAELFAEWGILGTLLFACGGFLFLLKADKKRRAVLLLAMFLIYSATATLARFDLWFLLGLLTDQDRLFFSEQGFRSRLQSIFRGSACSSQT